MVRWSWKCNYTFYRQTFLFVCLVQSICFLSFGRFCYFKLDFLFVSIPTVTKELNSPHCRGRAIISALLVCLTACQREQTIGPGLNERLLWAWDQATKPRSAAVSLSKSSFFTLKCSKCDWGNVFRPFFSLAGQMCWVHFHMKLENKQIDDPALRFQLSLLLHFAWI